jgi:hypothetical protein
MRISHNLIAEPGVKCNESGILVKRKIVPKDMPPWMKLQAISSRTET